MATAATEALEAKHRVCDANEGRPGRARSVVHPIAVLALTHAELVDVMHDVSGLPGALASRIVEPERPVVAVCGDGGFLMNAQELETAVRLGLDLVVLVLVDRGYGMIRWKQASMKLPNFGLDFGNPDFVRFAAAHGARGHRADDRDEFARRVAKTSSEGGVHLFEVPVAYEADNERLDRAYPQMAKRLQQRIRARRQPGTAPEEPGG